jgi:hypothetical protein
MNNASYKMNNAIHIIPFVFNIICIQVFLGHDLLVSPTDDTVQLHYKREGLSEEENQVFRYDDMSQLDDQLNAVLMGALQKNETAWKAMPAAQQALIAEKMQQKKEELKRGLLEHVVAMTTAGQSQVITSKTIQEILAKTF